MPCALYASLTAVHVLATPDTHRACGRPCATAVVRRYFDFEDERTALGVPQPDRVKRPSSRLVRHVQQEFEYAMVWPGGLSFSDLYAVAAKAAGSDAVHVHSYTLYEGFPMLMWMPGVKDGWPGLSLKSKYTRM